MQATIVPKLLNIFAFKSVFNYNEPPSRTTKRSGSAASPQTTIKSVHRLYPDLAKLDLSKFN